MTQRQIITSQMSRMVYSFYVVVPYPINCDERFPSSAFPALLYKKAFSPPWFLRSFRVKRFLKRNGWSNCCTNGINNQYHYHSNAHELICVIRGSAKVQLGGDKGTVLSVQKGDILIVPAGIPHRSFDASSSFCCIGAYPDGQQFDMHHGKPGERTTDLNIESVQMPKRDPLTGTGGKLHQFWAAA